MSHPQQSNKKRKLTYTTYVKNRNVSIWCKFLRPFRAKGTQPNPECSYLAVAGWSGAGHRGKPRVFKK